MSLLAVHGCLISDLLVQLLLAISVAADKTKATVAQGAQAHELSVERIARIIAGRRAPSTIARAVCRVTLLPVGNKKSAQASGILVRFREQDKLVVLTAAHTLAVNVCLDDGGVQTEAEARRWFNAHINESYSEHYNVFRRGNVSIACGSGIPALHVVTIDAELYPASIRLNKRFDGTLFDPVNDVAIILFAGDALRKAETFIKTGKWAFWKNELPPGPVQTNQECVMSGFGYFDDTNVLSAYPREGRGLIMKPDACEHQASGYGYTDGQPFGVPYPFLCLRTISGRARDSSLMASSGDSGGPVLCSLGKPRRYFLIGLIKGGGVWTSYGGLKHTIVTPLYKRELWNEFMVPALRN